VKIVFVNFHYRKRNKPCSCRLTKWVAVGVCLQCRLSFLKDRR